MIFKNMDSQKSQGFRVLIGGNLPECQNNFYWYKIGTYIFSLFFTFFADHFYFYFFIYFYLFIFPITITFICQNIYI
jgi:hypothetical protein